VFWLLGGARGSREAPNALVVLLRVAGAVEASPVVDPGVACVDGLGGKSAAISSDDLNGLLNPQLGR